LTLHRFQGAAENEKMARQEQRTVEKCILDFGGLTAGVLGLLDKRMKSFLEQMKFIRNRHP